MNKRDKNYFLKFLKILVQILLQMFKILSSYTFSGKIFCFCLKYSELRLSNVLRFLSFYLLRISSQTLQTIYFSKNLSGHVFLIVDKESF